jgi:RHS repeat-associated protein
VVTESFYFYAGGKVVGAYITKTNTSPQTNYFHGDHLGSISVVTDQAGLVIARYQYDAWGKRVLAAGSNATIHGFTGHEHLDDGLIHMNGRVYDPGLARFLSADPHIQDPSNLQSWNRYSYVLNNPLAYTDPSGYFSLKKLFRTVVAVVVAYYTAGAISTAYMGSAVSAAGGAMAVTGTQFASISMTASALGGAAGGFAGGLIASGGNFKAGLFGAIGGGIGGALAGSGAFGQMLGSGVDICKRELHKDLRVVSLLAPYHRTCGLAISIKKMHLPI